MIKSFVAVVAAGVFAQGAQGALVQFSSDTGADSYVGNFVQMGSASAAVNTTNQNLVHTAGAGSASVLVAVYDNPVNGAATTFSQTSFSVSADVRVSGSGSSFGFFIGDRDGNADDLLALLNVYSPGTPDTLRFASNANMSNNSTAGALTSSASGDIGLTPGTTLTLTLTVTSGAFSLSATDGVNTLTSTSSYTGYTLPANFEVGFRSGAITSSTNIIDNFSIVVPEPSAALAAVAMTGLMAAGRRRRLA